jgi:hypothetical protein
MGSSLSSAAGMTGAFQGNGLNVTSAVPISLNSTAPTGLHSASLILQKDGGSVTIGVSDNDTGAGAPGQPKILNIVGEAVGGNVLGLHNDGNNSNRYGMMIRCGTDNAGGTNYALAFEDGDGGDQGYVTFTSGTVSYGAFTAAHDAELPDADNETGYAYGTLVDTTEIFYKQKNGADSERGIQYKVEKTSSAYSKAVLGAYCGKHSSEKFANLHQINILGDGHILCNGEKGNIEIGDGICTSSTEGEGMKADKMAIIIGVAQEDITFTGNETKLVTVQYGVQRFESTDMQAKIDTLEARILTLENA